MGEAREWAPGVHHLVSMEALQGRGQGLRGQGRKPEPHPVEEREVVEQERVGEGARAEGLTEPRALQLVEPGGARKRLVSVRVQGWRAEADKMECQWLGKPFGHMTTSVTWG